MIFGIDVLGMIPALIPTLPQTLLGGLPDILGAAGQWAGCIAQHGAGAAICQAL